MRNTILVVDDEELQIELLRQIFENDYNIVTAKDGKEAIFQLNKYYKEVVIMLLDLSMPVLNGYQVLQVLKSSPVFKDVPIAMVTASMETSLEISCYSMGAVAVIHKPFAAQNVRKQIDNIVEMYQNSLQLKMTLNEQTEKLNMFYENLTDTISNLVEFRDLESGTHIKRVKEFTRLMAEAYAELYPDEGLTNEDIITISRASAMHDIGKIAIPDSILLKPGALTDEERQVMMSHTTKGCDILGCLKGVQDTEHLKVCYDICRYHHERYDGNGYPDKLKGDAIPLSAQLVSIVDVYDALVSNRVYKRAYSKQVAYNMIMEGECGVFSPKILNSFKRARKKIEKFSDSCR